MTANELVSAPVPAVVGTATTGRPGVRSGPSYSRSQTARSFVARRSSALAVSIDEPPPTGTTTVPDSPNARSAVGAPLDRRGARVRLDLREDRGLEAGCREHAEHAVDDARPADARVGHDEHPRATGRGDHLGESLDRADAEMDPVAQDDLDLAVGQARHPTISTTVSVEVSRRTVSQRRQP